MPFTLDYVFHFNLTRAFSVPQSPTIPPERWVGCFLTSTSRAVLPINRIVFASSCPAALQAQCGHAITFAEPDPLTLQLRKLVVDDMLQNSQPLF